MASLEYVPRLRGRPSLPAAGREERIKASQAAWRAHNKDHIKLYDRYRRTLPGIVARKAFTSRTSYVLSKAMVTTARVQASYDQMCPIFG